MVLAVPNAVKVNLPDSSAQLPQKRREGLSGEEKVPGIEAYGNGLEMFEAGTHNFALPGLRLGYLAGCQDHIRRPLSKVRPPWSLNAPARQAGIAALGSLEFYRGTWRELSALTSSLAADLQSTGLSVLPPKADFILVQTSDVDSLQEGLWQRRIGVRTRSS